MEIKYFRLIKTIAEEGSIANSSEKLFLTQSALSHRLKEMELQLGFKVFHRSRNKWTLTEEGEALHQLGNQILNTMEEGFDAIKQIRRGSVGRIKVSTECYSFYQGLSAFIQKMGMLYPDIDLDLNLEATHQPITKLLSHDIDIALVTAKPTDDTLCSVEVFEDEIFAVLHRESSLSEADFVGAAAMAESHLIIHSFPLETVSVHQYYLSPNKITPKKISAIPLTEVALEMVNANMGVMCMPKWALQSFKLSDELVFKKIGLHGLKRTHYLVFRAADEYKKYINDFVLNFKEDFQS